MAAELLAVTLVYWAPLGCEPPLPSLHHLELLSGILALVVVPVMSIEDEGVDQQGQQGLGQRGRGRLDRHC